MWWAERLREWDRAGKDVFAYFNNDGYGNDDGYGNAVRNAIDLRTLVGA